MSEDRKIITEQVAVINPIDEIERDCKERALDWVAKDQFVYRLQKPDVPKKHLVAYFVVIDSATNRLLLVHHNLSSTWLPTGGHIDPQEDPHTTVTRECREELGVKAVFLLDAQPMFISEAQVTDGDHSHTDVSLWYVIELSEQTQLHIEPGSFSDVKWWAMQDILAAPSEQFGPDVLRFVRKLRYVLHLSF